MWKSPVSVDRWIDKENVNNIYIYIYIGFPDGSVNPPASAEDGVRSLGQEDLLEREMTTHSSILAWRIPWTEPGGLQSKGLQETATKQQPNTVLHSGCPNLHSRKRVRHDLVTKQQQIYMHTHNGISFSLFLPQKRKKSCYVWQYGSWMNLKGIMLSKKGQTQKDKYCMIWFIYRI